MINIERDIHSLSDFKRNTPEFLEQLEKTGEPVVLTINGRAKLVVQDAASYQRMRELIDRAEAIQAIRQGIEDVKAGRTLTLDEFEKEIRGNLPTRKR